MKISAPKVVTSNLSRAGALLLLTLGAACGGSDEANSTSAGSSGASDGGGASSGGPSGTLLPDGGKAPVGENAAVDDNPTKFAVNLGMATNYAVLAKSGISTVPSSVITGNLGVSPVAASYITGFSLVADATNVFATSPQVTGKIYASDYAVPTPANLTTAVSDMELAFTDAAGRAPKVTELGTGNIGGMTLTAGVYKWATGLLIPTDVTLSGTSSEVWIFQVAQNLTLSSATKVHLTGGAVAKNVFWQVAGSVELGTTAHLEGVVLTQTSVALRTGASVKGRLLAQTAVTIDGSVVVEPAL